MFLTLMYLLFSCKHKRFSFPQTPIRGKKRNEAAEVTGIYVVCLECGEEFPYDWKEMRIVSHKVVPKVKGERMEANQAKFEGWAIIELFGHQREAGFVTTQYYGDKAMFQIDVPELLEREYILEKPEWGPEAMIPTGSTVKKEAVPGRSRLVNPGAVYAMNPCDEAGVRKALETGARREIKLIKLAEGKQLVSTLPEEDYDEEES